MSHGVVVINPKFRANVGMILRLCAGFGAEYFYYTGDRAQPEVGTGGTIRLPREERMKEYTDKVRFFKADNGLEIGRYFHNGIPVAMTPDGSEALTTFEHPENAVYVFGSEDKGIPQGVLRVCHRFVHIPSSVVLNLATAVAITLYDRQVKRALPTR